MAGRGIDLRRFTLAAVVGLAVLLGVLLAVVLTGSRHAIEASADQLRRAASRKVADRIDAALRQAEVATSDVETELAYGLLDPTRPDAIEIALFAEILREPKLVEVTFTYGVAVGRNGGDLALAPEGRGQISVTRWPGSGPPRIMTRFRHQEGPTWVLDVRDRPAGGYFDSAPMARAAGAITEDPTEHPTFFTPAHQSNAGRSVWSDLAWSELDAALPEAERRKVMTVQKALPDAHGKFAGVLRAGIVSDDIDAVSREHVSDDPGDPHRIFVCDREGRLITRLSPEDRFVEMDGDVRVQPAHLDPAVAAALALPGIGEATADKPAVARLDIDGTTTLATLTPLPDDRTQGWLVGIVVPEAYYLAGLTATRNRVVLFSAILVALVLVGGAVSLRALRAGLGRVVGETTRMRRFDFAPSTARSVFADVNGALASLETAKAALRALGRYVPLAVVKLLYADGREPQLGGAEVDLSMMFTDIEGFTTASETMPPDELAAALGAYLEVMTAEIHASGGIVDKFIGDAVMALWNAPTPTPGHAGRACAAALACVRALERLYASPAWGGRAPWHTRFGLHRDTVLVGHFGAPDRVAFTALGDGVNAASRIEGLNKQYGTTIIASEAIRSEAGEGFLFRRLDRVAVKGKSRALELFELVGRVGELEPGAARAEYEVGLEAYFAGRFVEAQAVFERHPGDPPSVMLARRCRGLAEHPPEAWDGVFRPKEK